MKALSLKQPWTSIVASGLKNIENRKWSTSFRGPVLLHASKTFDLNSLGFIKQTAAKLGILDWIPTKVSYYWPVQARILPRLVHTERDRGDQLANPRRSSTASLEVGRKGQFDSTAS